MTGEMFVLQVLDSADTQGPNNESIDWTAGFEALS